MGLFGSLKTAVNLAQKVDNIPLMKALLQTQEEVMENAEQIRVLREENSRLKKALETRDK